MAVIQGEQQYQMVKVTLDSGDSIEATAEHPFYIKGKGWNPASSLKVGQALQLHNGTTVVINEIDTSVGVEKVYNLTVANTHNYFVGESGVLVHNCPRKRKRWDIQPEDLALVFQLAASDPTNDLHEVQDISSEPSHQESYTVTTEDKKNKKGGKKGRPTCDAWKDLPLFGRKKGGNRKFFLPWYK